MNETIRPDTDEFGYAVETDHGVKCGNHGWGSKVYHRDVATVRACSEIRHWERQTERAEINAELAYERHLEDRGWQDARAQEDHEARMGVVDFQTAWAESDAALAASDLRAEGNADPGMNEEIERRSNGEVWPWADGQRPGQRQGSYPDSPYETRGEREARQACGGTEPTRPTPTKVEAGMYRNPSTDEIFKVQVAVHGSGQLYAKRLERLDVPKTLKNGKVRTHQFSYVPGAIRKLRSEWRMTLEQCQEFGALYGTCVRCGLTLTKEESIERRMGDTCFGKASRGEW